MGVAEETSLSESKDIETASVSDVEVMPQWAGGGTVGQVKGADERGVKSGERFDCIKSTSQGFKVSAAKFQVKVKKKINRQLLLMLLLRANCYSILSLTVAMFVLMGSVDLARVLIYNHGYVISCNGFLSVTHLLCSLRIV